MKRALCIATAIALTVPTSAGAASKTKVTVDGFSPLLNSGFYGRVESAKTKCMDGRRVVLYRKKHGKDLRVGADRAALDVDVYEWFVGSDTPASSQSFYAKVKPIDGCEGDRSALFEYHT